MPEAQLGLAGNSEPIRRRIIGLLNLTAMGQRH